MNLTIRPAVASDAEACAQASFEAHQAVAKTHNFPPEQPTLDFAMGMMHGLLLDPISHGLVAESGGRIVGSVFLHAFLPEIACIGPLTVHPSAQGGPGRALLEAALDEARKRRFQGVRLVQSPYHLRSLALYTKLGFVAREPLVLIGGPLPQDPVPGRSVRAAVEADIPVCMKLCRQVHGIRRELELRRAIEAGTAQVVKRDGRVVAYATGLGLLGIAIAEANADLEALISAAPAIAGPGFFVPIRNTELFSWLLQRGMHCLWPATLMTQGPYQEPAGPFLSALSF